MNYKNYSKYIRTCSSPNLKKTSFKYGIAYFNILQYCLMDCDYCYLKQLNMNIKKKVNPNPSRIKTLEIYKKYLKSKDINLAVLFSGGDPFDKANFDTYLSSSKSIKKFLDKEDTIIWLTSLYRLPNTEEIKKIGDKSSIKVSFHLQNKHSQNGILYRNLLRLKESGIPFEVNIIFDPNPTYSTLFINTISFLEKYSIRFYITFINNNEDHPKKYFKKRIPKIEFFTEILCLRDDKILYNNTEIPKDSIENYFGTINNKNTDSFNHCVDMTPSGELIDFIL